VKFILLIPVLLLFIGQTPWLKHMEENMRAKMSETKADKCCSAKQKSEKHCSVSKEIKHEEPKKDECCKTEARCACVCCFSVAPLTENAGLNKFFASIDSDKIIFEESKLSFQYYPVLTPPPDVL
jgi:hypothetical protein